MNVNDQETRFILLIPIILAVVLICQACIFNSETSDSVFRDVTGTLIWGGSPALDGSGMLFETPDTTYGVPGIRTDYSEYFPENENRILIRADFRLTGDTVKRGWGAEFPQIEFLRIARADTSE